MCEFCTKHGDGKVWFTNAANYARDLTADLNRRRFIQNFFHGAIIAQRLVRGEFGDRGLKTACRTPRRQCDQAAPT